MHKENKETKEVCKTMQQRGHCLPVILVFDPYGTFLTS
jgi:hypothetical protein